MRLLALGVLVLLAPLAASQEPLTQAPCPDALAPQLFAPWDTQLENLGFDSQGLMWVSDLGGDRMLSASPDGDLVAQFPVPGMHGLTVDASDRVWFGHTADDGTAGVAYFSPSGGFMQPIAKGLVSANGMTFDNEGNLFVSNPGLGEGGPYLVRISIAGVEPWGDTYGTNGLWFDGDRIVAAITADQSSPIVSISTSDPSDVVTIAELTFGAATLQPGAHSPSGQPFGVPKGLDDITVGPDGLIYAVGHVSGELLRVDPSTGDACVLASGFEEPTSVRFANAAFGAHAGDLFVTDMGGAGVTALFGPGAGAIWRLDVA